MQRGEHGLHGREKFCEGIRELCHYMMSDDQHHANLESELQEVLPAHRHETRRWGWLLPWLAPCQPANNSCQWRGRHEAELTDFWYEQGPWYGPDTLLLHQSSQVMQSMVFPRHRWNWSIASLESESLETTQRSRGCCSCSAPAGLACTWQSICPLKL